MTNKQIQIIFVQTPKGKLKIGISGEMALKDILFCMAMMQQRLIRGDFKQNGKSMGFEHDSPLKQFRDIEN